MKRLRALLGKLGGEKKARPETEVHALRTAFKDRYHHFKLLLNANNKALEVMSEIEQALQGATPFGMQFVRSRCTRISTDVFAIVKHLDALAPAKYTALFGRFKEIQHWINPFAHPPARRAAGPLVVPMSETDAGAADLVGPKMANLAELAHRLRIRTPRGFVITSSGFEAFLGSGDLQAEINRRIQSAEIERPDHLHALSAALQQLIIQAPLPEELRQAIEGAYDALARAAGRPLSLAVRSSALGEDLAGTSFAGQYRSVLNVGRDRLVEAYKEVAASKYGLTAISYRLNRGIREEDVPMCAGCLEMVPAVAGGVLYTRNPLDIRARTMIVNSAWGLPKSVVEGGTAADQFVVTRGGGGSGPDGGLALVERRIPTKTWKYVCHPGEGVSRMDLSGDEAAALPSLSDEQVLELARLGLRIESYYGAPQDIEWALDPQGNFILLQCRPLRQVQTAAASASAGRGWPLLLQGGQTASAGVAAGEIFPVSKEAEALRFPKGAVLVTAQALPRWATLLPLAAAVITEQGTLAGHLANVAREFRVPAVFGLNGAMRELRGGEEVTVDAGACRVYAGRIDELLAVREAPRNLMAGSPVWQMLDGAARHIVPLHLLDPDGPAFRADKCRTFHDITRFCHEKAVREMFRFGRDHHFPERSGKQLRAEIPMQWWVLNLDDGFAREVDGAMVELSNIVSIPMLALWSGITAVAWEGPPPVDGKGFMSVMFQATANRSLLPTVKSSYANRNYFMISRNFCSLQSRLGFHFSIIESLVSERRSENYINFHFKGGGADFARRLKRVIFIRDILENHGFGVAVREDALSARLEHHDMAVMRQRLKILGYIAVHTRQLDMIMENSGMISYYRHKIDDDILKLLRAE